MGNARQCLAMVYCFMSSIIAALWTINNRWIADPFALAMETLTFSQSPRTSLTIGICLTWTCNGHWSTVWVFPNQLSPQDIIIYPKFTAAKLSIDSCLDCKSQKRQQNGPMPHTRLTTLQPTTYQTSLCCSLLWSPITRCRFMLRNWTAFCILYVHMARRLI